MEVVAVAQVMAVAVTQDLSFPLQVGRVVIFDLSYYSDTAGLTSFISVSEKL